MFFGSKTFPRKYLIAILNSTNTFLFSYEKIPKFGALKRNHDTQLNAIQPNNKSIVTLSIMTLSIMTLSIMTLSIMTLSIMTLSIMTLTIMPYNIIIDKT